MPRSTRINRFNEKAGMINPHLSVKPETQETGKSETRDNLNSDRGEQEVRRDNQVAENQLNINQGANKLKTGNSDTENLNTENLSTENLSTEIPNTVSTQKQNLNRENLTAEKSDTSINNSMIKKEDDSAYAVKENPLDNTTGSSSVSTTKTNNDKGNAVAEDAQIRMIPLSELHSFKNHPYKVLDDEDMDELTASIRNKGVLTPGIARKRPEGEYELIAGHRRKRACEKVGLKEMPIQVLDLTDDDATLLMVDTNIQRRDLKISETARALKMKYDALHRQGKRNDIIGDASQMTTADELAREFGISGTHVRRYIRLAGLDGALLDMLDEKKLPFNIGFELSYLTMQNQRTLSEYMQMHEIVPSQAQAKRLKEISRDGEVFTEELLDQNFTVRKKPVNIGLSTRMINRYFPEDYTKEQIENVIISLLDEWSRRER